MRSVFEAKRPDDIEMQLTITMTLGKWRELRAAIKEQYPGWEFSVKISELIKFAEEHFYNKTDDEMPK
jgi:hypothetical protein